MAKLSGISQIELFASESPNLDTVCYRGHAPLAHLALISQADIFDQVTNQQGLQRDLSPKHASDAYGYAARGHDDQHPRAFPEVVLNVRNTKVLHKEWVEMFSQDGLHRVKMLRMRFDLEKIVRSGDVSVSRIDGNHRLFFAAGDDKREPILHTAPFQIHIGLDREQERSLFVDINANQKGLNSSHLAIMQNKLTPEENEIKEHLDRWIADKLTHDPESPWHGIIHLGGSKKGSRVQGLTRVVNFASLQTGVSKTLKKSQYMHDFTDPNAQYALIRNYWNAVKQVFSEEWATPKQYHVLKNVGVLSLSILGGTIIDRCIPRQKIGVQDMAFYLNQCYDRFNWHSDAPMDERAVSGMSGNQAALIIAGELSAELTDNNGSDSIRALQSQLLIRS